MELNVANISQSTKFESKSKSDKHFLKTKIKQLQVAEDMNNSRHTFDVITINIFTGAKLRAPIKCSDSKVIEHSAKCKEDRIVYCK